MNAKNKMRTPDILGSVMGAARQPESNKAIKHNKPLPIKPACNKAVAVEANNTYCKPESNKAAEQDKEKTTFNLSSDLLERLEDSWLKLRRRFKGEQRVTKTLLVERALELALDDLESNNESSDIFKMLHK